MRFSKADTVIMLLSQDTSDTHIESLLKSVTTKTLPELLEEALAMDDYHRCETLTPWVDAYKCLATKWNQAKRGKDYGAARDLKAEIDSFPKHYKSLNR